MILVFSMGYRVALRSVCLAVAIAALGPAALAQRAEQAETAKAAGGNATDKRIAKLEEQIVDLQVVIGTLQSLINGQSSASAATASPAPNPYGAPAGQGSGGYGQTAGAPSDLNMRFSVIETQIRALTDQMEQMSRQLTGLQSGAGPGQSDYAPAPQQPPLPGQPLSPPPGAYDDRRGTADPTNSIATDSGFGTVTVTRNTAPPAGADIASETTRDSRVIYEQAYRHLLQRDYVAAQSGFQAYLAAAPTGQLAANAQYWLGETHYAQGQYRVAADVFLKGYRRHRTAGKAPDSLLKLGMSLNQLGEKDAACATLAELSQNHPQAPAQIRQQADGERRRIGC